MRAPAGSRRPAATWAFELALLAPSLAAGVGLTRLTASPGAARVVAPVVVAVAVGQLAAAGGRRFGTVASLGVGALAVALVTAWWFEPSTVVWGLPTSRTFDAVGRALSQAVTVTRAAPTPVAAVSPVVMCVAAGAGLASAIGRALLPWPALLARRRALAWALSPGAGLFVYASLLSSGADRVQAAASYIGALVLVVLAADRLGLGEETGGAAGRTGGRVRARGVVAGTATAVASVVVAVGAALVAGPSLGATVPHVFLSATARTGPGAGGPISSVADTVALVDDVGALLSAGRSDVLFTARSDEPTYWQVAVLSDFDGRSWRPPPSTWTAIDGILPAGVPSAPAGPSAPSSFTGEVRVAGLRSTLLPVPPTTLTLRGAGAVFDPPVGALRAAGTAPGTSYSFVAASPGSPSAAGAGRQGTGPDIAPYLRLPGVPATVVALAHRIVAGTRTPFAEAAALARFFDSGRFRYSLAARQAAGDPLESFLFQTRTGFCQQFAGAYAVLARIDGLPTRVAVGFDAGVGQGKGRYVVTTADAHVWPEVYLGPAAGWVSFEPTPPTPGVPSAIAAGVVYGDAGVPGAGSSNGPGTPVTTNPRERAGGSATAGSSPASSASSGGSGSRAAGPGASGGAGVLPWPVLALLALVVAAVLVAARGRPADLVTALRTRALAPGPAVGVHWRRAAWAFERRAGPRAPAETMTEHAGRMAARFPAAGEPYAALTRLAARARYSGEDLGAGDADRARALGAQTRRALRHRRPAAVVGRVTPER